MKCTHRGKDLFFTSWMDSKPVHMLHTYPTMMQPVQRKVVDNNGTFHRIEIQRPTIIADYNEGMGGTDLGDQRNSYYRFDHRTTQWPHRIYSQFIMVSVTNAYICWKEHKPGRDKVSQLQYMIKLMHQLSTYVEPVENSDKESVGEPHIEPGLDKSKKRSKTWRKDLSRLTGTHTPVHASGLDNRGMCRTACTNRSSYYCHECQAFLCISGHGHSNCWWRFHNLEDF